MARVIYSNQVNELKGSVGGLTFHQNTSGSIVRLKPNNRNDFTKIQNVSKEFFVVLTSFWNSLTDDERFSWADEITGWNFENRYNESKVRSGFNYFMSYNMGRLLLNMNMEYTPGSVIVPLNVNAFNIVNNSSELSVNFQSTTANNEYYLMIYASPPNRLSFYKQRSQFRLIAATLPHGLLDFDLTNAYEQAYSVNWPIANETGSFRVAIAICYYNWVHGVWSPFILNNAAFEQL